MAHSSGREIDYAVEQVELLMAVRDDVGVADSTPKQQRKKRKADSMASASTSPTTQVSSLSKERGLSPLSLREEASVNQAIGGPAPEQKKRKASKSTGSSASVTPQRRGTLKADVDGAATATAAAAAASASSSASGSAANAAAGQQSTPSASTTSGYVDPARARREVLGGQLPLKVGRRVAFRQPPKSKAGPGAASAGSESVDASAGGADDDGETWILAVITDCINNDRNR